MSTPIAKLDLTGKSHDEKRAMLAAFITELNASPHGTSPAALDRWLGQVLDELDAEEMGSIEHVELQRRFTDWLETAGDVGGAEQDQDPSRPHPAGWHGHREQDE